jgi:conjugative transfer signal peptidase TraF
MPEARDLPLLRWGAELRRAARRRRRLRLAATGAIAAALLAVTATVPPRPRLVWNVSASAPVGLYRVTPGAPLKRGDMVVAWTPVPFRRLAAERHYLPRNVPLVKRIAALVGDRVCGIGGELTVNGRPVATRRRHDGAGRPLPAWTGCETLTDGRYLLLMAGSASFDGRYFGPIGANAIVGRAVPLWVR